jgi:hypothetical protein
MSLIDPFVKKFVLVSESCIPTNNFNNLYETSMLEVEKSRIHWTYGKNIDRYTMIKSGLPPTITPNNWMKQSQWMLLDRKHVQLLFQPNLQPKFTQFLQNFQYCPVPDEHFFINYFIHILKLHPKEFINHPITFVDWNSNSKHPKLFAFLPREIIQLCRDNKIFFARKFAPLQLTKTDINYILDITETVKEEAKIDQVLTINLESPSDSDLQEHKIDDAKEKEDIILSVEEKAIVEYFSGTLTELKKNVVKLTPKQITSIYSTLFTKPPTLLIDSDSESEERVNRLEVILEEPEYMSEDLDVRVEPILLEKEEKQVVSSNISLADLEPSKDVKEEVVSPKISLADLEPSKDVKEEVVSPEISLADLESVEDVKEEVVSPEISLADLESVEDVKEEVVSPEISLADLESVEDVKEEVVSPEISLADLESVEDVKEEVEVSIGVISEELVNANPEVVKETEDKPEEVKLKVKESHEVEIKLEELEPVKVIQPKNNNTKKSKKGN